MLHPSPAANAPTHAHNQPTNARPTSTLTQNQHPTYCDVSAPAAGSGSECHVKGVCDEGGEGYNVCAVAAGSKCFTFPVGTDYYCACTAPYVPVQDTTLK